VRQAAHVGATPAPPFPAPLFVAMHSEIKPDWLVEIAPHYYSKKDIADDGKKLPKGKGLAPMPGESQPAAR
jgi:hypothetical protein